MRPRWVSRALVGAVTVALAATTVVMAGPANAAPTTSRLSSASTGVVADNTAELPALSDDGRYVTFTSNATNLVPQGQFNFWNDVFIKDRQTGVVEQISVNSRGELGEFFSGGILNPSPLTPDGRFVAFDAYASNLVDNDTNRLIDTFLRDRVKKTTIRVSVDSIGGQADGPSAVHGVSADGRYVLFNSRATNLVKNDTNNALDVFIHDTVTGETKRVSVKSNGAQVPDDTVGLDLSNDGRYVLFTSFSRYTSGDNNNSTDAFVKDLQTGSVERVSVRTSGKEFRSGALYNSVSMSADARYVGFTSSPNDQTVPQVYVRDRVRKTTTLVSLNRDGNPGNFSSYGASVSPNGRYVAFGTGAENMVSPAPPPYFHVYVRDLRAKTTVLASVTSIGTPIPQSTGSQFMCNAGVAFTSFYPNVVFDGSSTTTNQSYFRSL
jgi:WD40-like Beta Propeller Repeat